MRLVVSPCLSKNFLYPAGRSCGAQILGWGEGCKHSILNLAQILYHVDRICAAESTMIRVDPCGTSGSGNKRNALT